MIVDAIAEPPASWREHAHHAAVLGSPIDHSLSPVLHNAAYRALEIPWTYSRREVVTSELGDVLNETTAIDVGFSLTMPLKVEALRLADGVTSRANRAGVANTLVRRDLAWFADNTDIHGITAAVWSVLAPSHEIDTMTVLGAGGTARAALLAAETLGVKAVSVVARREEQAREVESLLADTTIETSYVPWADAASALHSDVVVSTVVAGAADTIAALVGAGPGIFLDVIYAPWPTRLAGAWQAAGGTVIPGTRMLLHQAVEQVRLMTGVEGPIHNMRAALESDGAAV